jgi:hypothetical protein
VLEEHNGSPVVAAPVSGGTGCQPCFRLPEVLRECACRASALLANITRHSRVERISTHNLVNMCGGDIARLNERIEALDADGRAAETERSLRRSAQSSSERKPLHLGKGMSITWKCGSNGGTECAQPAAAGCFDLKTKLPSCPTIAIVEFLARGDLPLTRKLVVEMVYPSWLRPETASHLYTFSWLVCMEPNTTNNLRSC